MAWASAGEANRPPRPLLDVAEQLALAAAADFSRRLADLVIDDLPSGGDGPSSEAAKSRAGGAATPDGELDRAEAEELDLLRGRMHALASVFADKFTACVDDQVTAMWKQHAHDEERGDGGVDAGGTGPVTMKKGGGKLRRSFRKKFARKKHKETPEAEAERKQLKKLEKEGQLKQLIEIEGATIQWVKCKVCLKRQPGGFMLSFFSPPKSAQPRSGIFCFLITEVRQTTHEELPDVEHSFVIRGVNNMEYILLAHGNTDMWSWIAALRECTRLDSVKRNVKSNENGGGYEVVSDDDDDDDEPPPPPPPPDNISQDELSPPPPPPDPDVHDPHPHGRGGLNTATSASSLDGMVSPDPLPDARDSGSGGFRRQPSLDSGTGDVMQFIEPLQAQLWFHGMLSRQEATMLVCQGAMQAHGTFLVRQSESRQGQLVLTFNCRGRAKHMRMTIVRGGQCKVHQWTFDNVFHMLDYFKINPVPLDNGTDSDVILTSYVVASTGGPMSPGYRGPQSPPFVTPPPHFPGLPTPGPFASDLNVASPSRLAPAEGGHPAYVNDVFPGGVMISPPSMQALHERSASNPLVMVPANVSGASPGAVQPAPIRVAVTASGQPVSRPRSSTFAVTASDGGEFRSMPPARPTNDYQIS